MVNPSVEEFDPVKQTNVITPTLARFIFRSFFSRYFIGLEHLLPR